MSGYMGLSDVGGECPTYATTAAVKFCSLNFVTSSKWTGVYIVVADGNVRIYDSEKTYMTAPLSFAQQFTLTKKHSCSPVTRKAYNQNLSGGTAVDFFCFYLQEFVEPVGEMRLIKIGCLEHEVADRIIHCIDSTIEAV